MMEEMIINMLSNLEINSFQQFFVCEMILHPKTVVLD